LGVETDVRLLVVTDSLANGGAERQLALTVTHLPEQWDIRCFSVGDGPFATQLREHGVRLDIAERRWRYDPLPFLRLWGVLAKWRPQLVHSWGHMTTLTTFPVYRALGIPFINGTIRYGDVGLAGGLRCKAGYSWASLVVANSMSGLVSAGIAPGRGRVIRNGFDFSRIPAVSLSRTDHRFTVVMAARMHGEKDWDSLFDAARILAADLGSSRLRVMALGDGPDRARLECEARDLTDNGVLEFGFASDVVSTLKVSDCGVLMSTSSVNLEGCSNAILEYMACGLPVICSKGGGTDELVVHGETGFLVAPSDSQDLAARLRWVYSHPEAAKAMGAKASETVKRDYSVNAMIRATLDAYAEALARG
jgi:glycosyltransferase involved in cell wall biosynthesis